MVEPDIGLSLVSYDTTRYAQRVRDHERANEHHAKSLPQQFKERAAAGVEFSSRFVESGAVDNAIADETENAGCDMIVMVTHGRGTLGEFLFGSHTKHVISRSKLPVLVLH